MVAIKAEHVSLDYPVLRKLQMANLANREGRINRGKNGFQVAALRDVSFSLKAGDRLALIGTNGSGKTTLLKVLQGIYRPTEGAMHVDGRTDALFNVNLGFRPEATGRRNIELRGLINGWSEQTIAERMEDIISYSELGDFIDMPFRTYSQGMAARLAFATATSFQPEILLMDEWIGAGDPSFQEKARDRLSSLIKRAGILVIASHNKSILRNICEKGLVLDKGRLVFMGDLEEAIQIGEGTQEAATKVEKSVVP